MSERDRRISKVESGVILSEKSPETKPPKMYEVIMYNDNFTPMDFVVDLLRIFFFKPKPKAMEIMLKIHTGGKAVCGIYTKNVAEMKISQVHRYSTEHEYPLRCDIQPLDG